jgi:hypothetical protein
LKAQSAAARQATCARRWREILIESPYPYRTLYAILRLRFTHD